MTNKYRSVFQRSRNIVSKVNRERLCIHHICLWNEVLPTAVLSKSPRMVVSDGEGVGKGKGRGRGTGERETAPSVVH